jgi:uncharacterized delta-60 repeat protein
MRRVLVFVAVMALAGGVAIGIPGPASGAPGEGAWDTTFDTDGKVITAIGTADDRPSSVVVQPDGKIVEVGWTMTSGHWAFGLARFTAAGALDTSFDVDGKVVTQIPGYPEAYAESVALQRDGKIVVAGYAGIPAESGNPAIAVFALTRYTSTGLLDPTFGTGGIVTTEIGEGGYAKAYAVAVQPDQKIVVAGDALNPGQRFAIARYTTTGDLDQTFAGSGKLTPDVGGSASAEAVVVAPGGRIVAAGRTNSSSGQFALVGDDVDRRIHRGRSARPGRRAGRQARCRGGGDQWRDRRDRAGAVLGDGGSGRQLRSRRSDNHEHRLQLQRMGGRRAARPQDRDRRRREAGILRRSVRLRPLQT